MPGAFIGVGSNIGNREGSCLKAIELLARNGISIKRQSSMYETEPWGIKVQPSFINMAVEIETEEGPEELLDILKDIEKQMGRTETVRWGPRIIDLDILFYDDLIVKKGSLEIPHPYMHERDFVLRPLCEIAPDKIHPVLNRPVRDLLVLVRDDRG